MNICIVTPSKNQITETFILAHRTMLKGNIISLYGHTKDSLCTESGEALAELYGVKKSFWFKILPFLPYHYAFKIIQKHREENTANEVLKRYLRANKINLVLAEYGTTGVELYQACNEINVPLVVHFHGFDASRYDVLKRNEQTYKEMFQAAAKVIVVSERMMADIEKMGCPPEKLALNPYGPQESFGFREPNYESNNILSVGRFTEKKAPYLTILAFYEAWKKQPSLQLKMVGEGSLLSMCKSLATSLGLENNIHFLGAQQHEKVSQFMSESFLFVQHSIIAENGDSEGTPVAILEASASGLPIVSTYHAGIPDVVLHENTGYLVQEQDVEGMALYIIKVAENRDEAKKMGQAGRLRVQENFKLERHIKALNQIFIKTVE